MRRILATGVAAALVALGAVACEHAAAAGAPHNEATAKAAAAPAAAPSLAPTPAPPVAKTTEEIPRVTPKDAKAAVDAGTAVIVDVRDQASWDMGHVKGALHIPLTQLDARLDELPRDKRIIAYCS